MRGIILALLLHSITACAAMRPDPPRPLSPAPTRSEYASRRADVESSIGLHKTAMDVALRSGDLSHASSLFSEDVVLVMSREDTVVGRRAVYDWLNEVLHGGSGKLETDRSQLVLCPRGAYEWGGIFMLSPLADSLQPAVSSFYAVRWSEPDTATKIVFLTFDLSVATSPPEPAECLLWTHHRSRKLGRTQVMATVIPWDPRGNQLRTDLGRRGWSSQMGYKRLPDKSAGANVIINISHRVKGPLVLGVMTDYDDLHMHVAAYNFSGPGSHVTVDHEQQMHALTVGWQRGHVRVAGGPAVLKAKWQIVDSWVTLFDGQPMPFSERSRTASTERRTGFLIDGVYALPLGRLPLWFEARVQQRIMPRSRVTAEPFAEPLNLKNSAFVAGVSLGVSY